MINPTLTIITVCFNAEKLIRQTMESVLNQSFKNYEYIIIDGGSTDQTIEIIKKYEDKFNGKMKWISEADKGIYDAMNKGIELSVGEWLYFLNSGDYFYNNSIIENFVSKIRSGDLIIYGDIVKNNVSLRQKNIKKYNIELDLNYLLGNMISHQAMFFNKNVFVFYGKYNLIYKFVADHDILLKVFLDKKEYIKYINFPIASYLVGGYSDSNGFKVKLERIKMIKNDLSKKYLLKAAFCFIKNESKIFIIKQSIFLLKKCLSKKKYDFIRKYYRKIRK